MTVALLIFTILFICRMLSTQNSVGMAQVDSGSLGNTPRGMDWTSIIPYTLRLVLRNQKYVWIIFSHNRICLPSHRNYVCVCVRGSVVSNSVTSWTVTHQDPLSKGFSRQEYWSGLGCHFLLQKELWVSLF